MNNISTYNQALNQAMPWTALLEDIEVETDSIEVGEAGYQEITFSDNKGSTVL